MAFLSSLFGSSSQESLESRLQREYAAGFQAMGMNSREAANMAQGMLTQAKEEVRRRGWAEQGPNYGDWLLQQESVDANIHAAVEVLHKEGVTDQDIRWWWNMPPLERVMVEKVDELNRSAAFLALLKKGLRPEQAAQRMWQSHPKFGNPQEALSEDRPLPIELKGRIVAFIERHYGAPEVMRQLTEQASSFNALVRSQILLGNL